MIAPRRQMYNGSRTRRLPLLLHLSREFEPKGISSAHIIYCSKDKKTHMELWQIARRMRSGEFAKAGSRNITSCLFRIIRILKQRNPQKICYTFQLSTRAICNNLFHKKRSESRGQRYQMAVTDFFQSMQ
jgi:hypothetical protein